MDNAHKRIVERRVDQCQDKPDDEDNNEKAKEWLEKGAQPSDRVKIFLSSLGMVEKPIITEKTKKHLPKKKTKEKAEAAKESKPAEETKAEAAKESKPADKEKQKKTEDK